MKKVFALRYMKDENNNKNEIIGLYSTYQNAISAGERAYKNITGEKEFYWTDDYGYLVRFDGENGQTSKLSVTEEELDSVLMQKNNLGE